MNLYSKSYFIERAKSLRTNNYADVDLGFQEVVLPVIECTFIGTRAAQLILLLLSFKWPKLAGAFFVSELFLTLQSDMVPRFDHSQHIQLSYSYLTVTNIAFSMI